MRPSLDQLDERRRQHGHVFVRCRSEYKDEVAALQRELEHEGRRRLRFFPPGMLSLELLTEQRRWQLLSMIDRFIGPAEEIWIYETDDYYDSWWTIGELVTLAYRRNSGYRSKTPPPLYRIDPIIKRRSLVPDDFLPRLTEAQARRMARFYANSDTAQLSPEGVVASRFIRELPLVGRLKYYRDYVWSDEFWRHPILDCRRFRRIGARKNRIDIDSFLTMSDPGFRRLTSEETRQAAVVGEVVCPGCGTRYRLEADEPQSLWTHDVNGHPIGHSFRILMDLEPHDPKETSLVALPTWRFVNSENPARRGPT